MGALKFLKVLIADQFQERKGVLLSINTEKRFAPDKEFLPISLRERKDLIDAKATKPIFWVYENNQTKRIELSRLEIESSQRFY